VPPSMLAMVARHLLAEIDAGRSVGSSDKGLVIRHLRALVDAAQVKRQRARPGRQRGGSESHREQQKANALVLRTLGDGPIRIDAVEQYVNKRALWPEWAHTEDDRKAFIKTEAQRLRAARRSEKNRGTIKHARPSKKRRNPRTHSNKTRAR
jgi:hypothetical protein